MRNAEFHRDLLGKNPETLCFVTCNASATKKWPQFTSVLLQTGRAERLTTDTTRAIDHAIGASGPAVLFYRLRIGLHHLSADDGPELSVLYEVSQALQGLAHDFDTACTVPEIKTILSDDDFSPMWPKTHLEIRV